MAKESALSPGSFPEISFHLLMDYSLPFERGQYVPIEIGGRELLLDGYYCSRLEHQAGDKQGRLCCIIQPNRAKECSVLSSSFGIMLPGMFWAYLAQS